MKRILGLDLGSSSIGWAVVDENSREVTDERDQPLADRIVGIGSRIVPLTTDENAQFTKGQALTKNADRTRSRSQRKGYNRYQLRRSLLLDTLGHLGMYDGQALHLPALELWRLRARAVTERVSLPELGRVLCHINQKRGYRTVKSDFEDKKPGQYVNQVIDLYHKIGERNMTVGQYLYDCLKRDPSFRCKDKVFPRIAYVEEFDAVMSCQQQFYPEVLTYDVIAHIRDYIIFYQRPLKSCKHLVAKCELERHDAEIRGRMRNCGPRVAPRTSPLFQICKIWECINNLNIRNSVNDTLFITRDQKRMIFRYMNTHEKIKATELKALLCIHSKDWQFSKAVGTGLQGNTTYCAIHKALENWPDRDRLLQFDVDIVESGSADPATGEVRKIVDASFEHQPLYRLWHTLYSISDMDELRTVLIRQFSITDDTVLDALCRIDFVKAGYGNKSSRAMRKILPYLQEGMTYYDARMAAGYRDTSLTDEQNRMRVLASELKPVPNGEMRQPVVEKVLNQLVNLVNALMAEYGRFDEIRIELARELKQSHKERESATKTMAANRAENERCALRIKEEYGLVSTRSRVQKYKMWEYETGHRCMYCGDCVGAREFLLGVGVEVEHIIPKSLLFDDSFSNKVCACRKCNQEKGNRTAYDFMESKGGDRLREYIDRVNKLADQGNITKAKRNKLLMPAKEIPEDFIERQLRESQYIAKKAKEMLLTICHNVYATSGSITDFIRHIWGWDEVLHDLNLGNYRNAGLTEIVERDDRGRGNAVERIAGWNKRLDHRHHAVDALTIACTKQGYIQRINNLSSLKDVSFLSLVDSGQTSATSQRLTRLEHYIRMQPHFPVAAVRDAVDSILVSFKSGIKVASTGKRYRYKCGKRICVQNGINVPRGALHEGSVYGRIRNLDKGTYDYVIKYKVESLAAKDIECVVDKGIRDILHDRLSVYGGNAKKAFAEPVLDHQGRPIWSVRCRTGLKTTVPLRYNSQGEPMAFVKPGSNHHIAIYEDEQGTLHEHIVTFWHAVERKKYGIPVVITDPAATWDLVTDAMSESFQRQLPLSATWQFQFSIQRNEMFVLGMDDDAYHTALQEGNYALLSNYLYRVQKITSGAYVFRKHTETQADDKYNNGSGSKTFCLDKSRRRGAVQWVSSIKALLALNPHKVHISIIGKITAL